MAGHSKWANIQHRKGAQDKKRGKLFTKLMREVMVAARTEGPDPLSNARLRIAIDKAKAGEKIGDIEAKEMIQDGKKKEKEFLEELKEKEKEEVRPQDRVGNEIPDRLIARFEQQKHTEAIKLMSSKIQEAAFEIQNAGIVPLNFESVIGRAKYIWNEADAFSPILVCRKCRGSGEGCSHCHGEGCTRAVR